VVAGGCCGRPALSEGRVGVARRALRGMLDRLAPLAMEGVPVVVLEPSCWSMLREDAARLLPDDPRVPWVRDAVRSLERHLLDTGLPPLRPPASRGAALAGREPLAAPPSAAVAHSHCHSRALGDEGALGALLDALPGVEARPSGAGCCGMAGAFGYRHPEVSLAIAADRLLPAIRGASLVVAPGTSCRHQVTELAGVRAVHPAQLLREALA
ncbi:MAG TPA: heterodisulfide reductase-related iron-sulfur binding cluster, partial [Miltoncostaeaceae bacterium]|nr:heterodisulfide reductase-related iron-sulfur binding cluster [Miltoncostaeaceae bacterium]